MKRGVKQGNRSLKGASGRNQFTDKASCSSVVNLKVIEPLTQNDDHKT